MVYLSPHVFGMSQAVNHDPSNKNIYSSAKSFADNKLVPVHHPLNCSPRPANFVSTSNYFMTHGSPVEFDLIVHGLHRRRRMVSG